MLPEVLELELEDFVPTPNGDSDVTLHVTVFAVVFVVQFVSSIHSPLTW